MNELEKMTNGKLYSSGVKECASKLAKAHDLCFRYNKLKTLSKNREKILKKLFPNAIEVPAITGPLYVDYGFNMYIGRNFYANYNFTCLDCAKVEIGDNVFCGTNVSILTPVHPFLPEERNMFELPGGGKSDMEYAKPIKIGSNCWIASNVTIVGGVTIGDGCVIGAGSIVTRDIPANSLAVGNPAKVIRKITKEDSVYLKKELF